MPAHDTRTRLEPAPAPSGWLASGEPAWQRLSERIEPLVGRIGRVPAFMPASSWLREWVETGADRPQLAACAPWQPVELASETAALARAEVLRSMGRALLTQEQAPNGPEVGVEHPP